MGYLRKLGKKKYRIIYDLGMAGGKRRQRTETLFGLTKQQAQGLLAKRKNEVSLGELSLRPELQMNELFDRFMRLKSDRLAPSTLQRYEGLLAVYLRPAFGAMSVGILKAADLTTAYARWSKRKIGARTVRHAADLMRNVLNRAVKWDLIPRNPALLLDADDLPRLRKPTSAVLSEAELGRLLEEARSRRNARANAATFQPMARSIRRCVCGVYRCAARGNPCGPLVRPRSQRCHRHDHALAHGRSARSTLVQGTEKRKAAHALPLRAARRDSALTSGGSGRGEARVPQVLS